jgi:ribosomal protein L16/L10AE
MSPTVLKYKEYRLFFFSREEKRMHIHVSSQNGEVKYWIEPEIELAQNIGFSEKQLNEVKHIILKHINEITDAWIKHFNS